MINTCYSDVDEKVNLFMKKSWSEIFSIHILVVDIILYSIQNSKWRFC